MAVILFILAFMIKKSRLPEIDVDKEEEFADNNVTRKTSVFQFPHLMLGVLCIFLYVGVEVLAGDAIGPFGKAIGMSIDKTKYFTSFTLIAMLIGYIIGVLTIPKIISQQLALRISALLGMLFSICIYFTSGYLSITFIALLGLANALMWPSIFPLAISGLGKFTKIGSALLIMGIAGAAVIPPLYAALKDRVHLSTNLSFVICTLPCYVYILYYSISGYKAGKTQTKLVASEEAFIS
jgi:glucose/galactose transporter